MIGSVTQAIETRAQLLNQQSGKWLLSQAYPDEFEYYMVGLELLDSTLTSKKFFVFPVNPNSIEYSKTFLTKVSKTAGGISVLKTEDFVPADISLSGTFGRDFKVLINGQEQNLVSGFADTNNIIDKTKSVAGSVLNGFSERVKSGYGCCKVMEDIIESSQQRDDSGQGQFLILYNLAFNQKFFVEAENIVFQQSLDSNMIWNYSVKFKVVGRVDDYIQGRSNSELVGFKVLQDSANNVYSGVSNLLRKGHDSIFG